MESKREYFQIKNYTVVPSRKCIPFDWNDYWHEDSETILKGAITPREIIRHAFRLSNSEVKRLFEGRAIIMDRELGLDEPIRQYCAIKIGGHRVINVWFGDHYHTWDEYVGRFFSEMRRVLLNLWRVYGQAR